MTQENKNPADIHITDNARNHIQKFLAPLGEQAGFRFGVRKSGCSGYAYVADAAATIQEGELCIEDNGVRIFVIEESIPMIKGTVIDLIEKNLGQKQLCFNNNNVEDSCGCGESFTVKSGDENE